MVVRNHTVGVIDLNRPVARSDVTAVNNQIVAFVVGTHVFDAEITAGDLTLAERDGVTGELGHGCRTANRAAVGIRGVHVAGDDATALEEDVAAAVTTHHHTSRHCRIVGLERQILEEEIVDVHQGHRTVNVGTRVDAVVHDDDAVHVVTLEGDGIGSRLPDVVLLEIETRVGSGTQMENSGATETAEIQGLLDGGHVREVRIGAAHGVMALQQAVTSVGGDLNRIVGMETVSLAVTGGDANGHVVVAVRGRERAKGK